MFTPSRKVVRLTLSIGLFALVAFAFGASEVAAQERRALLSEDLKQQIAAGDARSTSVIPHGWSRKRSLEYSSRAHPQRSWQANVRSLIATSERTNAH